MSRFPSLAARLFFGLTLLLWSGFSTQTQAQDQNRIALVIGNAAYANTTPLANPANDARAVAEKLGAMGFEVMLREDLTGQGFRIALGEFTEKALRADLALVFYAGHGIEMSGSNYMIPVDAQMRSEATAVFEAIKLDAMLTAVRQAGKLGMVMIDACRDNPFASSMNRNSGTRSLRRGLAPVSLEGESGLVVSFAAEAGSTADDGDGMHSPYTDALLAVLDEPGLEVGRMLRKVRAQVRQTTGGRQVPIERTQLPDEEIYLVALPEGGGVVPVVPTPDPGTVTRPPLTEDPFLVYLNAVSSGNKADLETFISRYPDHPKAADARKLLLEMADRDYWERILAQDNEDGYRTYLIVFPEGRFADLAKEKLATYQRPPADPEPPKEDPPFQPPVSPPVTPPVTPPSSQYSCVPLNGQWSVTAIPTDDTLFVRSGAGSKFKAIGELPFNANGVRVQSCGSNGWCQVTYGCTKGYAFGRKYLKQSQGGHPSSAYAGSYSVVDVASNDTLNLRSGPGKSKYGDEYGVVAELPYNATGVVVSDCQVKSNYRYRWCSVQWQNVSGWAYGRLLQTAQGYRPAR
ncbi:MULTISPECIES: caspase family protein [unclassified Marinovum]